MVAQKPVNNLLACLFVRLSSSKKHCLQPIGIGKVHRSASRISSAQYFLTRRRGRFKNSSQLQSFAGIRADRLSWTPWGDSCRPEPFWFSLTARSIKPLIHLLRFPPESRFNCDLRTVGRL